jgi:hypothetical protein
MRTQISRAIIGLIVATGALFGRAAENELFSSPHVVGSINIEEVGRINRASLCLLDGQVGFLTERDPRRSNPDLALVPADKRQTNTKYYPRERFSASFVVDGARLRVLVDKDQLERSKVQADKDNWYLTADYSTPSPRVILTKVPTKSSHWRFVDAKFSGDAYLTFIWNENEQGKGGWLTMGNVVKAYRDGTLREAILSSDKKTRFELDEPSK